MLSEHTQLIKIIRLLWSVVDDMKLYIVGKLIKTIDEIETELDIIEYLCRPFAEDTEDPYLKFLSDTEV